MLADRKSAEIIFFQCDHRRTRYGSIFINLNFGVQMEVKNTITQPIFGTTTIQMIYLPNLKAVKLTLMEFISRQKKDIVLQLIQN